MTPQELQAAINETQKLVDWNNRNSNDGIHNGKVKAHLYELLALQLKLAKGE